MNKPRMRCVVVVCGDPDPAVSSAHGGFASWFLRVMGPEVEVRLCDARCETPVPAWLDGCDGLLLSGSPHSVYDALPWVAPLEALVRDAVLERTMPTLGVCFGHQLLAQALGGRVALNPRGREMGTITVQRRDEWAPILDGLGVRFEAQATHRDTVIVPPRDAIVHAYSDQDQCQVFSLGSAFGVQFHPEVTAPILRSYIRSRADVLRAEGRDPQGLHDAVHETITGPTVIRNFLEIVRDEARGQPTPSPAG